MKNLGYFNGTVGTLEEMRVPMTDRSCFYGDGVYDASCAAHHRVFALEEHVARFYRSAALLRIEIPMGPQELTELLEGLVKRVDAPDQFVYWQVTRGTAQRDHPFPEGVPANLWVMLTPEKLVDLYRPGQLLSVEDTRFFHCNAKTLNLIPNVLAAQRAKEAGCCEVVFHRSGRVTEGAHSNVHILKDGVLRTAPTDNLILPGITRAHLIQHCRNLGIPVDETPFTLDALMEADEILITSCSTLGLPIDRVDGRPVGGRAPGLLNALRTAMLEEYRAATEVDKQ